MVIVSHYIFLQRAVEQKNENLAALGLKMAVVSRRHRLVAVYHSVDVIECETEAGCWLYYSAAFLFGV